MLPQPTLPTFSRSDLRNPDVIRRATQAPIRVLMGTPEDSLVILPERVQVASAELHGLSEVFVRAMVELQRPEPSAALLGEVGFVAHWPKAERDRFLLGFAEALAVSLRTESPAPAMAFIKVMSTADTGTERPDLSGRLSTDVVSALAKRMEGLAE